MRERSALARMKEDTTPWTVFTDLRSWSLTIRALNLVTRPTDQQRDGTTETQSDWLIAQAKEPDEDGEHAQFGVWYFDEAKQEHVGVVYVSSDAFDAALPAIIQNNQTGSGL